MKFLYILTTAIAFATFTHAQTISQISSARPTNSREITIESNGQPRGFEYGVIRRENGSFWITLVSGSSMSRVLTLYSPSVRDERMGTFKGFFKRIKNPKTNEIEISSGQQVDIQVGGPQTWDEDGMMSDGAVREELIKRYEREVSDPSRLKFYSMKPEPGNIFEFFKAHDPAKGWARHLVRPESFSVDELMNLGTRISPETACQILHESISEKSPSESGRIGDLLTTVGMSCNK